MPSSRGKGASDAEGASSDVVIKLLEWKYPDKVLYGPCHWRGEMCTLPQVGRSGCYLVATLGFRHKVQLPGTLLPNRRAYRPRIATLLLWP